MKGTFEHNWITLKAPAKINLYLRILGNRPDGYHEIDSLMQKLQLHDVLRIRAAEKGVCLSCPGSDLPENRENLVFRAAEAFIEFSGIPLGLGKVL